MRFHPNTNLHTLPEGDIQWTKPPLDELPTDLEYLVCPDKDWPWVGHFWKNVELHMLHALSGQEDISYVREPTTRECVLYPKLGAWIQQVDAARVKEGFVRTPWGRRVLAPKRMKIWDVCLMLILSSVADMKLQLAHRIVERCGEKARIVYTTTAGIWWAVPQEEYEAIKGIIREECGKTVTIGGKDVVFQVEWRERA